MKRFAYRPILAAFIVVIGAICAGCDRDTQGGPSRPTAAKPTPPESFERIVESFRRQIEDQQVGFVFSDGTSRTTMIGTNKVTSELIPPASPGDHFKAVISVTSRSTYSLRRSKNGSEDNEHDQNAKNQSKNSLTDPADNKGFPSTTADSSSGKTSKDDSKGGSKSNSSSEEIVMRRPDEKVQKYELAYDNQHWALVTPLNLKTEKSIQFAFEKALANQ